MSHVEEMLNNIMKEIKANKQSEEERKLDERERRMDEEERKEREEEKRQTERQEDKKEMMAAVKGIKEGVKVEMLEVLKPWQDRTARVEKSTAMLEEELSKMASNLKELREKMEEKQEVSYAGRVVQGSMPAVLTGANTMPIGGGMTARGGGTAARGGGTAVLGGDTAQALDFAGGDQVKEERERIGDLLAGARRGIGLKPIDKRHVEKVMKRLDEVEGETSEEKEERARLQAVTDFFKYEMRMKSEDMEELAIVKIFPPAKEEWNTLYVELRTWEMARFALSFTTYMRRGTVGEDRVEVVKYVPRDLYQRFRAVNALGNKARMESDKRTSFRVTFGREDFVLQLKDRGSLGWGKPLALPADLPPFERHVRAPNGARSPGEAPGRPALTPEQKRKRARASASPSGTSPLAKRLLDVVGSPDKSGEGPGLLAATATIKETSVTPVSKDAPKETKASE